MLDPPIQLPTWFASTHGYDALRFIIAVFLSVVTYGRFFTNKRR